MSVRVLTDYGSTVTHDDATHFAVGGQDDGTLVLSGAPDGWPIATYARGRWVSAQRIADPDPEPPLLKPGTVVRIPGMDVPYVVNKGVATSGARATLAFTTVDGRDWSDDRSGPVNAATPLVNAAEPDPRVTDPGDSRYGDGSRLGQFDPRRHAAKSEPGMDLPLIPDSAVLSETVEPYVSVSVTGNDADEVLNVWRRCAGAA